MGLRTLLGGVFMTAIFSTSQAHSWIEQLMVIAPNGTMVGEPGFPRGNLRRGTPAFNDPAMVNLIPSNERQINDIRASDPMCKSSQISQTQTDDSPRLRAAPGAHVALRFQENGHVSLPETQQGKPPNRGTVFVYGTTQPREDDAFLSIHRVWNADGTGGDGRGVLLSTQNYDDGQCYQVNGGSISSQRQKTFSHATNSLMGADLWCQQDIQIPTNAPTGQPYTLYWVWDWPTLPGTPGFPEGKQEIYTTCMDVDVVNNGGAKGKAIGGNSFIIGQDFANAAIKAQVADIQNPTAVVGMSIPFSVASGTSPTKPTTGTSRFATEFSTATARQTSAGQFTNTQAPSVSTLPGFQSSSTRSSRTQPTQSSGNDNNDTGNNDDDNGGDENDDRNDRGHGHGRGRPGRGRHSGSSSGGVAPTSSRATAADNTGTAINSQQTQAAGSNQNVVFVTEYDTAYETVYETVFQRVKRAQQTGITTTSENIRPSTTPAACSKLHSAYQVRARNPFYILPSSQNSKDAC